MYQDAADRTPALYVVAAMPETAIREVGYDEHLAKINASAAVTIPFWSYRVWCHLSVGDGRFPTQHARALRSIFRFSK